MKKVNAELPQLFENAFKAYKKPVLVKITGPLATSEEVKSLENDKQLAKVGDYIVTGVDGERYPISAEVFANYEAVEENGEVFYRKKKQVIRAIQVDFEGVIETAQGSILNFQPSYYIVMQSPTDAWAVEKTIFEKTYEKL